MEPKQSAPNLGPETAPINYGQNFEQSPTIPTPEAPAERRQESLEQRSDAAIASASPAAPVLPSPVVAAPQDDTKTVAADDTPTAANDDDLIEKEWVDKAKKIILQTKDDPFRREQEVEKLQADYLRKRYGRELGASQ